MLMHTAFKVSPTDWRLSHDHIKVYMSVPDPLQLSCKRVIGPCQLVVTSAQLPLLGTSHPQGFLSILTYLATADCSVHVTMKG